MCVETSGEFAYYFDFAFRGSLGNVNCWCQGISSASVVIDLSRHREQVARLVRLIRCQTKRKAVRVLDQSGFVGKLTTLRAGVSGQPKAKAQSPVSSKSEALSIRFKSELPTRRRQAPQPEKLGAH